MTLLLFLLIPSQASAAGYIVRSGDTLSTIASRENTSVTALARANGITDPNSIQAGRYLTIPGATLQPLYYHVRWGDTLSGVAARYRVSISTVRALNPRLGAYLLAGSWIRLCGACTTAAASAPSTSVAGSGASSSSGARYVVQPGDTVSGIAVRFGVAPASITSYNGIGNPEHIVAGTSLIIPGATGPVAGASASGAGAPSSTSLARALVVSWARTYGILASLPLAVAWQESGFNQALVSSTGAVGVMQIEPYTATRISAYLGRPINIYNVYDNVQAGVFWLTHLLVYYGWNKRLAVGAYYQGTKAIAAYGFYSDTVHYIDNVLTLQNTFGS